MNNITFSQQFFDLLKKVVAVAKPQQTLLYKKDGRCRITVPGQALFTHLSAGPADLNFDCENVNIFSLSEFVKYAEAINYPTTGSVSVDKEVSMSGRFYEYIKFSSSDITCRTITADPSCFKPMDRNTPRSRDADPMKRVAEIAMDEGMLKDFDKKIKLVPGCRFITLMVDDRVKFYMKGKLSQQITYLIDSNCTRYIDDALVKRVFLPGKVIMFPAMYFSILKGIGAQYDIDIRNVTNSQTVMTALKAHAAIPGANPDDPIRLFVGASEVSAAATSNYDLVV